MRRLRYPTINMAANLERHENMPTPNSSDPLRILREDTYTNDDINRMTGEMHRRQYAESQQ